MDYQVAIHTYGRQELIADRALATLEALKVDRDQITVFVPNSEQLSDYKAELGDGWRLVVSAPGQFRCRQFYHNWFAEKYGENQKLIQVDDDIAAFSYLVPDESKVNGFALAKFDGTLDSLAKIGYGVAESVGTRLWGMSFRNNEFYMANTVTVGNLLVMGRFQGAYAGDSIYVGSDRTYLESQEEDAETSLRAFVKYGKVVRLNFISSVEKIGRRSPGGIRGEQIGKGLAEDIKQAWSIREMTNRAAFETIQGNFPGLVKIVENGDSKFTGITRRSFKYKNMGNITIPREVVEAQFGPLVEPVLSES